MKKKVVLFSQIHPSIHEQLADRFELQVIHPKYGDVEQQLLEYSQYAEGMIGAGRILNRQNLARAEHLKVISSVSVGYDNYDLQFLNERHIWLTHTPHVLTESTADLAFALLLSAARQVPHLDHWTKQGQWQKTIQTSQFGVDVFGKTLGVIGLGHIGAAIARRGFHGFNMNILYHNRNEKPEFAEPLEAQYCQLNDLLQQSDFVVIAVDLNASSKALIDEKAFALMQRHAVLVNISRGAVIDEAALVKAIKSESIFAAGLDVYQQEPLRASPLFDLPRVVTLPHIGSATAETRLKMAEVAFENLCFALEGRRPKYLVNPHFD